MICASCGFENPVAMRFCGGCGRALQAPTAVDGAGPSTAHRRHMTVMFVDIVGSTPLAETLDPEDFREILEGYQEACARATDRFFGYIARYAGDGIVVYFGYPQAREDSAQCAVYAGLALLEELEELNGRLRDAHGISLRVRIGIHTGIVVAGEMGVGETRERMAIVGETPHIAARLESIAAPQTVLISDDTRALVEGYVVTESLGAQHLKGVSRPIEVHRALRTTGAVGRLEVATSPARPGSARAASSASSLTGSAPRSGRRRSGAARPITTTRCSTRSSATWSGCSPSTWALHRSSSCAG
jgi:class 3 adenylate cyclase